MAGSGAGWGQTPAIEYVDSRIYTDEELFERELAEIWKKVWVPACHESELPEPYDYRTLTIAREPVIVCRGEDGQVRAFLNVCPHRANLIVRAPAGTSKVAEPSGNAKRITCMYHGWQFDMLGKCVEIPRMLQGYQDRLDKSDASLIGLPCTVVMAGSSGSAWTTWQRRSPTLSAMPSITW